MSKKEHIDPIPDEFESYEEAAEFWDTHDTTDYPEAFRTVDVVTEFRSRHYEVEIEEEVNDPAACCGAWGGDPHAHVDQP